MRVLLIEDDERLLTNLKTILIRATYAVDDSMTGKEGLAKALSGEYDCILLDWMLPDIPGTEVIIQLKKQHIVTPVLLLTARSIPQDIITGLDLGAQDYITKPFDAEVLLARMRSAMRRISQKVSGLFLQAGTLTLNQGTHDVFVGKQPIALTPKEYALLEYLLLHKQVAVSRMDLITHVWDENANLFSNSVDVYVTYVRKKLAPYQGAPAIKTIKGLGYMLCDG